MPDIRTEAQIQQPRIPINHLRLERSDKLLRQTSRSLLYGVQRYLKDLCSARERLGKEQSVHVTQETGQVISF